MTLWEIDIHPSANESDADGQHVAQGAVELGLLEGTSVRSARGYLCEGELDAPAAQAVAQRLLVDPVVQRYVVGQVGVAPSLTQTSPDHPLLVHVLYKPGVMDPVADSTLAALQQMDIPVSRVATVRKYWFPCHAETALPALCEKLLANASIERTVIGPLRLERLEGGAPAEFQLQHVLIRGMDDAELTKLSRDGQLYLSLVEMRAIQAYFRDLQRDPTDVELETIAQTWSEHCSHKTLAGPIEYEDEQGRRTFENMLKETIFSATQTIRSRLGDNDWCVSVFEDNAGIVRFHDDFHVVFKVETHNHPSALEPYGGANTGIGGVIRDTLGTGLGARPIANTDVFCFAPPDYPGESLPAGVLHPQRVMQGVVGGVRDYGNRMGIPTVNGAILFDERYLGNPLVYCGNVGLIPVDRVAKHSQPGDLVVSVGGRTGRDGIHGATFSSAELTSQSEEISGGAVQIGNAITEKMVADVLLAARDRGLYHAITDCGAGGYSSAVGEMAAELGAEVWLEKVPLKYDGLTYTEIWISEAQERMVVAVPPDCWETFHRLCAAENVEATVIGQFNDSKHLVLKYHDQQVGQLTMKFLHHGRPRIVRQATYQVPSPPSAGERARVRGSDEAAAGERGSTVLPRVAGAERSEAPDIGAENFTPILLQILSSWNVASKEWVIRQYDHEVQGSCVIKPLVGVANDGPGDAAVVRPIPDSFRGLAISCGINPRYGDLDTYDMAASAIDEAVRNCVAVGADPARIAILDNFCWGNTERPETLGSLVRAAIACHDTAIEFGTPFISGKDSLNNEFTITPLSPPTGRGAGSEGSPIASASTTIAIPPTLLISAIGRVNDIRKCVTMDLKEPGNAIYLVGLTKDELGGSHYDLVTRSTGLHSTPVPPLQRGDHRRVFSIPTPPTVDAPTAAATFAAIHHAIEQGLLRACHDLSEGGLAVALAEMSFAGGWGAEVDVANIPVDMVEDQVDPHVLLFSESNSRFLCEVAANDTAAFESILGSASYARPFERVSSGGIPFARMGTVADSARLLIRCGAPTAVIDCELAVLKETWQGAFAS